MLVIEPVQQGLAGSLLRTPVKRGILLDQPAERRRQAHIVLMVLGRDRQRAIRHWRWGGGGCGRRAARGPDPLACLCRVELGDADHVPRLGPRDLGGLAALQSEKGSGARARAVAADQLGSLGERCAENAREGEPADRAAVRDLEYLGRAALDS